MNDFLEIGFWRQRYARVERVLELAERLTREGPTAVPEIERQLEEAVRAVRAYDAKEWPFPRARTTAA